VGEETIDEVIVNCSRGDATPPEVNHAIAVRRSSGGLRFERTDDPYHWVLPTARLELAHIEGIYVGLSRSAAAAGRSSMKKIDNRL
jgi:hypothetical protein